jgi:hypothetical protein
MVLVPRILQTLVVVGALLLLLYLQLVLKMAASCI